MSYAVIRLKGKQYKVSEGDEIAVDKHDGEFAPEVLLVKTDKGVSIGTPTISNTKVVLKKLEDRKNKKVRVFKFKSKSKYRRTEGARREETLVKVQKIS